jgi:hypothetical protein
MSTPDRRSAPDLLDIPLTTQVARSRPGSRDFAFAGGIAPPPLVVSPPPEYTSPTSGLHTISEALSQSMATAAEILGMDAAGFQYSASTAGDVPTVEITEASAVSKTPTRPQTTLFMMTNDMMDSGPSTSYHSAPGTQYSTARGTAYETARPASTVRDSLASYQTAPPPVPSKYATASEYSESAEPIRYQLHDPDVQWGASSLDNHTEYYTPRPPTSYLGTAEEGSTSMAYRSAMSSASPRSSGYDTAPPPPISRSTSEKQSFRSFDQEKAETGTHISEPDSDVGLLADLDRRSSFGSLAPSNMRKSAQSKSYYTARWTAGSGKTPLGTAEENTMYMTARESAYTTAATSLAEVTTARGTQE